MCCIILPRMTNPGDGEHHTTPMGHLQLKINGVSWATKENDHIMANRLHIVPSCSNLIQTIIRNTMPLTCDGGINYGVSGNFCINLHPGIYNISCRRYVYKRHWTLLIITTQNNCCYKNLLYNKQRRAVDGIKQCEERLSLQRSFWERSNFSLK